MSEQFGRSKPMSVEMRTVDLISDNCADITDTIEINRKGQWVTVPSVRSGDKRIIVTGKRLRIATVHDETWLETALEHPAECIEKLKEQKSGELKADLFVFAQKVPDTKPKYEYPLEWDSQAVVHISSYNEWWESLPQETRKNVRRGYKRGVTVEVKKYTDDLIPQIMEVNDDSPHVQGTESRYYGKSFEQVKKDHSAFLNRSDYICAYVGSELIGYLKLVYRGEIASVLAFLSKPSHFDKRPGNILIAKAVELCSQKNVSYLTYGKFNYGNKQDSPLRRFKIRNGFGEMLVPKYCVPLTNRGAICRCLGVHRGLLGILHPKIISWGLAYRGKLQSFIVKQKAGVA